MSEHAVVVTGASTGIGRACAIRLDELGYRVFAGVRRDEDAAALRAIASDRLTPVRLDITDDAQVAAAADAVGHALAGSALVGVVNNAGIAVAAPAEFLPAADLLRQLDINVVGQLRVTQAFMPMLRESHGRVVFMSSLAGRVSQPVVAAYTASKHALEALADALRMELTPWRIEVSIIEPGAVATPIWDKGLRAAEAFLATAPPRMFELYGAAIDAARAVSRREAAAGVPPEMVAQAVVHALTSSRPRTRYIVGREARMGILARRILPDRVLDRVILRTMGLPLSPPAPQRSAAREPVPVRDSQPAAV